MASHNNAAQEVHAVSSLGTAERCSEGTTAPKEMLQGLHHSQAGTGRHKCPICAWREGFEAGQQYTLRRLAAMKTAQVEVRQ